MKKIKGVISNRNVEKWPSSQLIFEWEDYISESLSIPIVNVGVFSQYIFKIFSKFHLTWIFKIFQNNPQNYYLCFVLNAIPYETYVNRPNVIPIIVDFYLKGNQLENFYKAYRYNEVVFISSLEVYNYLKSQNCPLNLFHLPLSISDSIKKENLKKQYEIVLLGRQNKVLSGYLEKFVKEYNDVEYVYESKEENFLYISSKKGVIGKFENRKDYLNLLRKSEICFYSTPGIDGEESRTNGFNQVTPRYLEYLLFEIKIIARYSDNEDTRYYELTKICPSISNYEEFKNRLIYYRSNNIDKEVYSSILQKNYTSKRVEQLKDILETKIY